MARYTFPGTGDKLVYQVSGGDILALANTSVAIYTDLACTTLADIQDSGGIAVPGSVLVTDSSSRLPDFKGPNGTPYGADTLYARVVGQVGNGTAIYARTDERLDSDTVVHCTSATRPTSPIDDQLIFETDTNKFLRWSTADNLWLTVVRKYAPDVVEVVANSAAFSALTTLATSNTIACDGVTAFDIMAQWSGGTCSIATDVFLFQLFEDGTQIAEIRRYAQSTAAGATDGGQVFKKKRVPSAGNHVYTLKAVRSSGTGTYTNLATASAPTFIEVKEAG